MEGERRVKRLRLRQVSSAVAGRPLKTSWLTLLAFTTLLCQIAQAFLVMERRFNGHLQSSELIQIGSQIDADGRSVQSSYLLDVEMLAQDVATSVTYFLKNVHERMVITNIAIKDPFVSNKAL